jgi:uncharacterized membrane protein YkoI
MKLKLIAAVFAGYAAISVPAFAEDAICTEVGEKKPIEEAKAVAVKVGFADVTKMDEEGGCYEAKGLNANGSKFEVYIHPTTLQIVKVKIED